MSNARESEIQRAAMTPSPQPKSSMPIVILLVFLLLFGAAAVGITTYLGLAGFAKGDDFVSALGALLDLFSIPFLAGEILRGHVP